MPKSVRLSEKEQEKLYRQMVKLNKRILDMEKRPIQETDIIHYLIENFVEKTEINQNGEIILGV